MNCEGWYLNYKLCPTLKELFDKYEYNINKISNIDIEFQKSLIPLEGDLSKYSIDFRGDGMGIIIIDYSNYDETNDEDSFVQDIHITNLSDLLQLPVFISTWNKYRWREQEYTEEEKNEIYLSLGKSLINQLQQLANINVIPRSN